MAKVEMQIRKVDNGFVVHVNEDDGVEMKEEEVVFVSFGKMISFVRNALKDQQD